MSVVTQAIDERIDRAGEPMAIEDRGEGLFRVTTLAGETYIVDVQEGRCLCPDFEYNDECSICKHILRCRIEYEADQLREEELPDFEEFCRRRRGGGD